MTTAFLALLAVAAILASGSPGAEPRSNAQPSNAQPAPALPADRKLEPIGQSDWIAPSEIYARACRGERCFVGFVGYTLLVNAEGRATDCAVTRTSGDTALDIETCNLLLRGARFKPATNAKGEPIKSRYASAVTWTGRRTDEEAPAPPRS